MVITTGCLQYLLIMNIMLVVLANAVGQEKPFRVNKNWKRLYNTVSEKYQMDNDKI